MSDSPPVTKPIPTAASAESEDLGTTELGTRPIVVTIITALAFTVAGNAVLWWGAAHGQIDKTIFWAPVFAIVTSVVAIAAYGGFYIASRRARVAIGASFILTFFVLLAFSLTITALGATNSPLALGLVNDFRAAVVTVVGFYFGAETVITVSKTIAAVRAPDQAARSEIARLDRDLPVLAGQRRQPTPVAPSRRTVRP